MSLVQELVAEKYNIPRSRRTIESIKASNEFMFALEVPSEISITNTYNEERKSNSEQSYRSPYLRYSQELIDEWFKDECNMILFLSMEDVNNVKKKWRKIKNDPSTFGTLVAITLLNDAPETAEKLDANPGVLYNGVVVYDENTVKSAKQRAELLNKIVEFIDSPEYVSLITYHYGVNMSVKIKHLNKADFEALHSALIKTTTTHYKMDNTPEIIASLEKLFWIVLGLIEDAGHWNGFCDRL